MTTFQFVWVGVILLAATGCSSSSSENGQPSATTTVTATATVTATPEPPKTPATAKLGKTWNGNGASITVSDYRTDVSEYGKEAGTRLDAVMARTCISSKKASTLSWYPWSLVDKNDGLYPAESSTWGDFPLPEYPFSGQQKFASGDCAAGWIVFRVPTTTAPLAVRYDNGRDDPQTWRLAS
jgi:hypothetical protein